MPLFPPGFAVPQGRRVREAESLQHERRPCRAGSAASSTSTIRRSRCIPSIEGMNTGAAVILVAGGGHNTLNVGTRRRRLRPVLLQLRRQHRDPAQSPAPRWLQSRRPTRSYDAQQAIRLVRAYAKEWNIDPNKIGIMGFSAGAELAAPAAVLFEEFDKKNSDRGDPLAGDQLAARFRRHHLPGPDAVRPRRDARRFRAMRRPRSSRLRRLRRPRPRGLGERVLRRDAQRAACRISRCTSTATAHRTAQTAA